MLLKRVIVSLIFIPILLYAIFTEYEIPFYVLVQGIIILGMWEFYNLSKVKKINPQVYLGILGGLLLSLSFYISLPTKFVFSIILLIVLLNSLLKNKIEGSILSCAVTILGIFYISWNLSHLVLIKKLLQGKEYLLLLFIITWMSEVFAYGFGTLLGKHKLSPNVSPNKTTEGLIAGVLGGVIFSFIGKYCFMKDLSLINVIIIGVGLGIWGQLGDLVESLFKRDAAIKDSGSIIPGHGGVLDVFDGIIFNAPLLYYMAAYF